jgi:uncharacterized protein with HEPN domain
MPRDRRALLYDILGAAAVIRQALSGRDLAGYRADVILRSAVERQFMIIGEALARLDRTHDVAFESVPNARQLMASPYFSTI